MTNPPEDPKVHALVFSTDDHADERQDAQDRIESYVVAGAKSSLVPYGNQLAGQRSIRGYMRVERPLPEIGDVLMITENEGDADEYFQFVRVSSVDYEDQQFYIYQTCGTFTRRVVTLGITDALRETYHGREVSCQDGADSDAILRETASPTLRSITASPALRTTSAPPTCSYRPPRSTVSSCPPPAARSP